MPLVAVNIRLKLLTPKLYVRCRRSREAATGVTVPEASVHKDDSVILGKYYVRRAGQATLMKSESQACRVKGLSYPQLGTRISTTDCRHDSAASLAIDDIHSRAQKIRHQTGNLLGKFWRYCIANLMVLGSTRATEEVFVRKGLQTGRFPYREAPAL